MSPDIRKLFADAADDSERAQIDAAGLLARGRRKVRIRRAGAAAGTGLLAAIAVAAIAQLPRDQATGPVPPADTPTVATVSTSVSPRVPESAVQTTGSELVRKLSYTEAVRRCRVRMQAEYGAAGTPAPVVIGPGQSQKEGLYVTDLLPINMPDGSTQYCSVPSTVRPTWAGPRADARRECGRRIWANLASWTVAEQRDSDGGLAAALMSPDRRAVVLCDIDPPQSRRDKTSAFPDAYVFLLYGPQSGKPAGSAPNGAIGAAPDSTAIHWLGSVSVRDGRQFWGGGGLATRGAVRYVLFLDDRELAETPVRYGIYAMRVLLPAGITEPNRVLGYDASGKAVENYQPY